MDTYSALQTAIARHAWRTGDTVFEAATPDFITLGESRINRQLRVRPMETFATATLSDGEVALPADYLQFISLKLDSDHDTVLRTVSPDYGAQFSGSGTPLYFSISDSAITVYPSSDGDVILHYYAKIPALSVSNTTNWLLTRYPDIYLYAALTEAAPFMMDDARLVTWGAMYDRAIKEIRDEDVMSKFARASRRPYGYHP